MEILKGKTKCVVIFRNKVNRPNTDYNAEEKDSEKRSLSKFLKDIETEKKSESKDYAKSAMEIGTRTSRNK